MTFSIFTFSSERNEDIKKKISQKLIYLGAVYDEKTPHIVITIGGDGTVLKAVHHYISQLRDIKFVGVHTGNLGYYTEWLPDEIDELVDFLMKDTLDVYEFPLLEAQIDEQQFLALNEFTILNATRTQQFDIAINNEHFESFRGTGLCISTPTGSTAYNKSLGGAIIDPSIRAFQLTEIASINNNAYRTIGSSIILPESQQLTISSPNIEGASMTQDHLTVPLQRKVIISLANEPVSFIKRYDGLFWNRLRQHFL